MKTFKLTEDTKINNFIIERGDKMMLINEKVDYDVYYIKNSKRLPVNDLARISSVHELLRTHKYLRTLNAVDLTHAVYKMHKDVWSTGKTADAAERLINDKHIDHYTMQSGDVLYDKSSEEFYLADGSNFVKLDIN